jgi:hypothetical protein
MHACSFSRRVSLLVLAIALMAAPAIGAKHGNNAQGMWHSPTCSLQVQLSASKCARSIDALTTLLPDVNPFDFWPQMLTR